MFQRSKMAHSCTEMWLVSVQPEGVRARPAPKHGAASHCRTQGRAALATQGKGRWSLNPALDTQSPEKKHSQGLVFNRRFRVVH